MAAALDLVPWAARNWSARDAVIAVAGTLDDGERLVDHPLVDHVAGDLVLDAGPDLVRIEHYIRRAASFRPGADDEALVPGAGEGAGHVMPIREVRHPVVLEDAV